MTARIGHAIMDQVPDDAPGAREIGFDSPKRYNASEILFHNLPAGRADKVAIYATAVNTSYGELCVQAARAGNALKSLGLAQGDRVLLLLNDTASYPAVFFGAIRAGFVPMLINTLSPKDLIAFYLQDSSAPVAVIDAEYEVAPAHRHTQSALRFILEGEGAYTTVNGERTIMHEGDFIITPPWAWHDHGNPSSNPIFWLDGLDIPVLQSLDASFAEHLDVDEQPITRPVGDSDARYGHNLLPVDHKGGGGTSPVFNYPYARTREALERLRRVAAWDPCHGLKMRYTNPITGNHAMATMATFIQLLPTGFATTTYRSTDATVFVPIEGKGRSIISPRSGDDIVVEWSKRDIFVVPSWHRVRHEAVDGDAVIFSYSDRPIQESLHLFRENRGNA